jgi:hypothetical protein
MGKKVTKITVRTSRLLSVRRRGQAVEGFCARCGETVRMMLIEDAAAFSGFTARQLFRRVEAGRLHFIEATGSRVLICLNSLRSARSEDESEDEAAASSAQARG